MYRAGLQCTAYDAKTGGDKDGLLPAQAISGLATGKSSDQTARLEQAIDGTLQLSPVGRCIQSHVLDEAGLPQCSSDNTGAIPICETSQGGEENNLGETVLADSKGELNEMSYYAYKRVQSFPGQHCER